MEYSWQTKTPLEFLKWIAEEDVIDASETEAGLLADTVRENLAIKYYGGYYCNNCGATSGLEGHHKDLKDFGMYISKYRHCKFLRARAKNLAKLEHEMQHRITLLCGSCHEVGHAEQRR
jgi:hypothetical protein